MLPVNTCAYIRQSANDLESKDQTNLISATSDSDQIPTTSSAPIPDIHSSLIPITTRLTRIINQSPTEATTSILQSLANQLLISIASAAHNNTLVANAEEFIACATLCLRVKDKLSLHQVNLLQGLIDTKNNVRLKLRFKSLIKNEIKPSLIDWAMPNWPDINAHVESALQPMHGGATIEQIIFEFETHLHSSADISPAIAPLLCKIHHHVSHNASRYADILVARITHLVERAMQNPTCNLIITEMYDHTASSYVTETPPIAPKLQVKLKPPKLPAAPKRTVLKLSMVTTTPLTTVSDLWQIYNQCFERPSSNAAQTQALNRIAATIETTSSGIMLTIANTVLTNIRHHIEQRKRQYIAPSEREAQTKALTALVDRVLALQQQIKTQRASLRAKSQQASIRFK